MLPRNLRGRRIAILVADGFEKNELNLPWRALKDAGALTEIISLRKGKIRGMTLHQPEEKIVVQKTISDVQVSDFDGLFIPGGSVSPDLLGQSSEALSFVRKFASENKPIASLCHGPWLLVAAGLVQGRSLTSWPGIKDDIIKSGGIWVDSGVVREGSLLTARAPEDMKNFIQALRELFSLEPEEAPLAQVGTLTSLASLALGWLKAGKRKETTRALR